MTKMVRSLALSAGLLALPAHSLAQEADYTDNRVMTEADLDISADTALESVTAVRERLVAAYPQAEGILNDIGCTEYRIQQAPTLVETRIGANASADDLVLQQAEMKAQRLNDEVRQSAEAAGVSLPYPRHYHYQPEDTYHDTYKYDIAPETASIASQVYEVAVANGCSNAFEHALEVLKADPATLEMADQYEDGFDVLFESLPEISEEDQTAAFGMVISR